VREADLILAVGVRLGEMTTGGYEHLSVPRPQQVLVHLHPGPEELGRVYAADLMLQCALSQAGQALETLSAPSQVPWSGWTAAAHDDYLGNLQSTRVEPLDMAELIKTVNALVPSNTVYTNGAGNFSAWLHRYTPYVPLHQHGRTQLAPTSGAMGYGVPAAVAAALLYPERTVVNIAGDGDFLMTGQELATARAHGAGEGEGRLISIVVDNGSYGTIRMHQERHYPRRVSGSDLRNPDFAALALAYGWRAERVERTEQFEGALSRALVPGVPMLIHVKLDTEVISPRSTITQLRGGR
jgi:acetolactate synthase-1/2/3 large subunit